MNYYNDNDKHACAWLRELIAAKLIPEGEVDGRSITEVRAEELSRFHQCHFFAGIGGWSYALQLAGWEGPCWTGSCPCQPFSSAGKGEGKADKRHLWPAFMRLIRKCRPGVVFGEQVAGSVGFGWLDGVCADLEAEGYAAGAVVLGAHSVGAPHKRQRLYWVGYSGGLRCIQHSQQHGQKEQDSTNGDSPREHVDGLCEFGWLADAEDSYGGGTGIAQDSRGRPAEAGGCGHWSGRVIECRDGKRRRIPSEPTLFPLAPGLPGRVGLLRGAGNSIVPQVAAEFVKAFMECT